MGRRRWLVMACSCASDTCASLCSTGLLSCTSEHTSTLYFRPQYTSAFSSLHHFELPRPWHNQTRGCLWGNARQEGNSRPTAWQHLDVTSYAWPKRRWYGLVFSCLWSSSLRQCAAALPKRALIQLRLWHVGRLLSKWRIRSELVSLR